MGLPGAWPANGAPEARPDRRWTHPALDWRLHALQLQPGPHLPVDLQSPAGAVLQNCGDTPGPDPYYLVVPGDRSTAHGVHGHEQRAFRRMPGADGHREPLLLPG